MSTKQTPEEVEEVKDLEQVEEVQDLIEAPEEVKEQVEEVKAPVLRGGLRGAADPNMIQKHIDNYLAMLCGEIPVDSNVRTSAEYWLKRLATGEGAGSTKKIYCHQCSIATPFTDTANGVRLQVLVFNNDPTQFTKNTFANWMEESYASAGDTTRILANGSFRGTYGEVIIASYIGVTTSGFFMLGTSVDGVQETKYYTKDTFVSSITEFFDGVNAIN